MSQERTLNSTSRPGKDHLSILFLGTQMAFGGAQALLLDQALWFKSKGHKTVAAFFYDRDGLNDRWQKSYDIPLINLNAFVRAAGYVQITSGLLVGMWRLWKLLRAEKFDAVVGFTHDSNVLGLPLAWLAGVPVRIGTHLGVIRGMPRWREKLHSILVNMGIIQTLVASSTRTRDDAVHEGVCPERIEIIFNSITPFTVKEEDRIRVRQQLGLHEGDFFLLAVGRLVYEKGHEFLIQAIPSVIPAFPNITVGICGTGPLYEQLQEQISALSLDGRVRLLGQWETVPELLAAADAFVLSSRWEGLPMALLEAMMAGLPVIATKVQGVEEVIEDGVHGILVPLESPEELSKAILQLLGDPERRRKMGIAASSRIVQGYTTDRMCEKYLQLIMRLSNFDSRQ
jgi:glycosyltransferase involved in cell wall biosynthesis